MTTPKGRGKWLREPNGVQRARPNCLYCGKPAQYTGLTPSGLKTYRRVCGGCKTRPYRRHLKKYCEHCGFVALHPAQLDVDHIDGNSTNNDPANLQTLCANCHRLKTYLNQDWRRNERSMG